MNKIQHPSNNDVLGAPDGWDQSALTCNALPITRTLIEGLPAVASFWAPTPEEIEAIKAGRPVLLIVMGSTMPPVMVAVDGS